ncbi:MAG: zinc dependent phospholipase C family protein [Promethearchaeota archaeon]
MATWGSHFRIAENILRKYAKLNRKFFAIGNIAPDCGLPNKDWSVFTPPKDISHFTIGGVSDFLGIQMDKFILSDVKFYSKYLKNSEIISSQSDRSFLLGYFTHLITDNLWNYYIMKPLKELYLSELQNQPNFIWAVKRDWYDLDRIYITENKDSLFWTDFLEAEYEEDFIDFLPKKGIKRQLEFIKNFYQISKEEYLRISKKKFVYLEKKEMDNFILNSTDVILKVLSRIINKNIEFNEKISVLDDILIWN